MPDLILTDAAPEVIMEVIGINSPGYQARKKTKLVIYVQFGVRLWTWDVCRGLP